MLTALKNLSFVAVIVAKEENGHHSPLFNFNSATAILRIEI
jgi:hypothetical protein